MTSPEVNITPSKRNFVKENKKNFGQKSYDQVSFYQNVGISSDDSKSFGTF